MKKVFVVILLVLIVIIAVFFSFISLTWEKEFTAEYPDITASTDSAVIARGKYLVYGPAHCVYCHVSPENFGELTKGMEVPLSGGLEFDIPPGKFRIPNITPDPETGIGKMTDAEIARALRYSVNHKNKFMAPYMAFQDMSDEDIGAVISFLRSQEPVRHEVNPDEYTFLGKAIMAFGLLKPTGPTGIPPVSVAADTTAAYGTYLAKSVANCVGCHTARDMKTGKFTGPLFAGGMQFPPEPLSKGFAFISPNLTPDKETGIMNGWDEAFFIERFHAGRVQEGSPMPWEAFERLSDSDLKALYRFLLSLEPSNNKIAKIIFAPGEKFPN